MNQRIDGIRTGGFCAAGAAVMIIVHAYMEVTDSSREDFYCQGLGLTLKRRMSPTWIELAGANLSVLTSATGPEFISISSSAILMQSYPD